MGDGVIMGAPIFNATVVGFEGSGTITRVCVCVCVIRYSFATAVQRGATLGGAHQPLASTQSIMHPTLSTAVPGVDDIQANTRMSILHDCPHIWTHRNRLTLGTNLQTQTVGTCRCHLTHGGAMLEPCFH